MPGGFPVAGGEFGVVGNINKNLAILVRKSLDENVINSIAVQDDDELFAALEANSIYFAEGWFRYLVTGGASSSLASAADFRIGYSVPAGATFARADWGAPSTTTVASDTIDVGVQPAANVDNGRGAGNLERSVYMKGEIITGGTAGTFRVRFAQVTLSATETVTMKAGSRIVLQKYS